MIPYIQFLLKEFEAKSFDFAKIKIQINQVRRKRQTFTIPAVVDFGKAKEAFKKKRGEVHSPGILVVFNFLSEYFPETWIKVSTVRKYLHTHIPR